MIKQLQVWKSIAGSLKENIPVMLLYVLDSKGSSPGRQGFFMVVDAGGGMEGSIGGGIMEHKFVEMAKERLQDIGNKAQLRKQYHDKEAAKDRSGMICSGEQTILIYQVQAKDREAIAMMIDSLEQNKNGELTLSPDGIEFSDSIPLNDFFVEIESEQTWIYKEKTGYKNRLFIIGGGHCALALSKMMCMIDFYIHLFDERENLYTMVQNNFVHEKRLVGSYQELEQLIPSGDHHYVVIMTFGYRTDGIALRALTNKQFKYLGMLGSRHKIDKMFEELEQENVDKDFLSNIYSPVGLPINSQTPEEIAISIAAEIISIKNA